MSVFVKVARFAKASEPTKEEAAWLKDNCDVCKRTLNQCELDSCERWG